jgi:hypothetical protein
MQLRSPCGGRGSCAAQGGGAAPRALQQRRWRIGAGPRDQEDNEAPSTSYNSLAATIKCARAAALANGSCIALEKSADRTARNASYTPPPRCHIGASSARLRPSCKSSVWKRWTSACSRRHR